MALTEWIIRRRRPASNKHAFRGPAGLPFGKEIGPPSLRPAPALPQLSNSPSHQINTP